MTLHPCGAEGFAWIEQRAGCILTRNAQAIEARDAQGAIAGVVALDDWTPSSAKMHVAIEKPIAVRALKPAAFSYLWETGRSVAYGTVRASNEKALRFDTHLGFRPVARLRDGWALGEDLIVLELRKEDYRGR